MARPKPDVDKIRARLLAAAESQLESTQGRRLVLSDIAERVGMSQSYLHTFYPTKADLIRALAAKWFEAVEEGSSKACTVNQSADMRLEQWLLSILRIKRNRFDANPALFLAYLELAREHMDLVYDHVRALRMDLTAIVEELVPRIEVEDTVELIENATLLFRTPQNIAAYRDRATDEAAQATCRLLINHLGNREEHGKPFSRTSERRFGHASKSK